MKEKFLLYKDNQELLPWNSRVTEHIHSIMTNNDPLPIEAGGGGGTYARSPSPKPPFSGKKYTPYLSNW